jgi:hypothetical protein
MNPLFFLLQINGHKSAWDGRQTKPTEPISLCLYRCRNVSFLFFFYFHSRKVLVFCGTVLSAQSVQRASPYTCFYAFIVSLFKGSASKFVFEFNSRNFPVVLL